MPCSDPPKALLMRHFLKDLTIMPSGMAFYAADTDRATSEGGWRKDADWNRELTFFRLRNRQKLVRIRLENIRYVVRYIVLGGFCPRVRGGCIACSRSQGGFQCSEDVYPSNHAQRTVSKLHWTARKNMGDIQLAWERKVSQYPSQVQSSIQL